MQIIHSDQAPHPIGPYSQAVRVGDLLFLSGQIPMDPQTKKLVAGDIAQQTRQIILNLQAVLKAAGADLQQVVKTTVYMLDLAEFSAMNAVYGEFFQGINPARATVQVSALPAQARLEIEAIAYLGN